ncbi:MAG: 4-hydroxy-3-methylbut-2-enyl diphosphate reductase [Bacteroidetes bacterium]|nr:4-hydroxy-3-methylbut-2-enyl diphosphate reductase [Bacteroidota bacterium]
MAKIEVDRGAGFCFGVEQVIQTAESRLAKGEAVYGLGEMVHNSREMRRLHDLGFITIQHRELAEQKPGLVLFRAHGEPPSTYRLAAENNVEVIDGTCPIVLKLQLKIRRTYDSMDHEKEQVVIFGKQEHPETIGLLGQVNGDAVVVGSPGETDLVNPGKAVHLFSQTTMDHDQFREVEQKLKNRLSNDAASGFRSDCTICGQMKKRKPGLKSFAQRHDVVIFVSGRNSSNGKLLFEYCLSLNARTHWISDKSELKMEWFDGADTIGISGATSTSKEQLEAVSVQVEKFILS